MPEMWEAYLTIAIAAGLLAALSLQRFAVDLLALTALALLLGVKCLVPDADLPTPKDALENFGSESLITVGLLFAVVSGLEFTGGTELATGWLLRGAKDDRSAAARLLPTVGTLSAFLNNTPVVAALIPVVQDLAKRIGVTPARLLLPLSYATILGGMTTLLGTSTNLVVRDLYRDFTGGGELSFFAPAVVGLPAAVLGVVYLVLLSRRLLPMRGAAVSATDDPRTYTAEVVVESGPLVGKTIEAAGLRNLPGLYIAEIQRVGGGIVPAKPGAVLEEGDVLILVGNLESVVDLRKTRGLGTPDDQARKLAVPAWRRTLVEAVVSERCALLGKTIRGGRFRSHYNAAVVAVARGDRRLTGKLGDVRLEAGDVLLLEASPSFIQRRGESRDFYLVSRVEGGAVRRPERAWLSLFVLTFMVGAALLPDNRVPISAAALIAALSMIALRCCTMNEARRSVDWSLLLVIGAMMGVGEAMVTSGAAQMIADGLVQAAGGDRLATLAAIYVTTMICTELITNTAAALFMFPIAMGAAAATGIDPMSMTVAVMVAASASFITPFGYQTNLLVYTVGGYRPTDYVRLGAPLSLIVFVVAMVVLGR